MRRQAQAGFRDHGRLCEFQVLRQVATGLGADYDVNSDRSTFEVVDEQLRPILQFYRRDNPETLQVNYVAYSGRAVGSPVEIFVCHERGCEGGVKAVGEAARHVLQRIFKYPGHQYPGIRLQR